MPPVIIVKDITCRNWFYLIIKLQQHKRYKYRFIYDKRNNYYTNCDANANVIIPENLQYIIQASYPAGKYISPMQWTYSCLVKPA